MSRFWQAIIALSTLTIVVNAYYLITDQTPVKWGWTLIAVGVGLILLALHQMTRHWEDS